VLEITEIIIKLFLEIDLNRLWARGIKLQVILFWMVGVVWAMFV